MDEIRINCHIKGTRPLLMNAFAQETLKGPSRKGQVYDDEEEAKKRLHLDVSGGICQPARHLEACMVRSGAEFKFAGRKTYKDVIKSGVFVEPLMIPHINPKWLVDMQGVVVQKARIVRCRPRFDN